LGYEMLKILHCLDNRSRVVSRSGRALLPRNVVQTQTYKNLIFLSQLARCVLQFLVTANVVPSSTILVTLMSETMRSSGTSVLKRATRLNIPEDGFPHSRRRETLKSYIVLIS
jgi:hypothetical protein